MHAVTAPSLVTAYNTATNPICGQIGYGTEMHAATALSRIMADQAIFLLRCSIRGGYALAVSRQLE